MDRRRFLLAWLAGALVAPLAAETQEAVDKVRRIGFLAPDSLAARRTFVDTLTPWRK